MWKFVADVKEKTQTEGAWGPHVDKNMLTYET
jgi:hypothetical protein